VRAARLNEAIRKVGWGAIEVCRRRGAGPSKLALKRSYEPAACHGPAIAGPPERGVEAPSERRATVRPSPLLREAGRPGNVGAGRES
jgi:hypothetical protein